MWTACTCGRRRARGSSRSRPPTSRRSPRRSTCKGRSASPVTAAVLTYRAEARSLSAFEKLVPRDTTEVAPRPEVIAEAVARARADSAHVADTSEIQRAIAGTAPPRWRSTRHAHCAGFPRRPGTRDRYRHPQYPAVRGTGDLEADSLVAEGSAARRAIASYQWSGAPSLDSAASATVHLDSALLAGVAVSRSRCARRVSQAERHGARGCPGNAPA